MNESDANILLTVMQYTIQVLVMYWFVCKMVGIYKGADSFVKWLKMSFDLAFIGYKTTLQQQQAH